MNERDWTTRANERVEETDGRAPWPLTRGEIDVVVADWPIIYGGVLSRPLTRPRALSRFHIVSVSQDSSLTTDV